LKIGRRIYDMPILADDLVRYVGEKVAAVAAESEEAAERAIELIEIDYEPMEPLFDPLKAMQATTPLLHPAVLSYRGLPGKLDTPSNLFIHMSWGKGDIRTGFQQSDMIIENRFETQVVHQAYLEPHSCVVLADPSGGAEIWAHMTATDSSLTNGGWPVSMVNAEQASAYSSARPFTARASICSGPKNSSKPPRKWPRDLTATLRALATSSPIISKKIGSAHCTRCDT